MTFLVNAHKADKNQSPLICPDINSTLFLIDMLETSEDVVAYSVSVVGSVVNNSANHIRVSGTQLEITDFRLLARDLSGQRTYRKMFDGDKEPSSLSQSISIMPSKEETTDVYSFTIATILGDGGRTEIDLQGSEAHDSRFWQEGTAGNCNIVTFNGEDIVGVGYCSNDMARKRIIASHNRIVRNLIKK